MSQTIACRPTRRFLGEHEQVRAALALQLNFLQHVFTILNSTAAPRLSFRDNDSQAELLTLRASRPRRPLPRSPLSSSKGVSARPCVASYSSKPKSTPCCVCPPASST